MKYAYHRMVIIISSIIVLAALTVTIESCAVSEKISSKSGAQLWAENCQRCHNTPPPNTFSPEQWETIGMHMQSRALLTNKERDKIVEFLKQ